MITYAAGRKYKIFVKNEKNIIKVLIEGEIDNNAPADSLVPVFEKIHKSVIENKRDLVILDLFKLEFINSSGITCLIKWIHMLNESSFKYNLNIVMNESIWWQKTGIPTLKYLLPKHIYIIRKNKLLKGGKHE